MAKQVIKYRLNADGTIPSFLYTGNDGIGGVYAVNTNTHESPRELLMIGISNNNATGDFEVVSSKQALEEYLTLVGSEWTNRDYTSDDPSATVPFDPVSAAARVWDALDILNA